MTIERRYLYQTIFIITNGGMYKHRLAKFEKLLQRKLMKKNFLFIYLRKKTVLLFVIPDPRTYVD